MTKGLRQIFVNWNFARNARVTRTMALTSKNDVNSAENCWFCKQINTMSVKSFHCVEHNSSTTHSACRKFNNDNVTQRFEISLRYFFIFFFISQFEILFCSRREILLNEPLCFCKVEMCFGRVWKVFSFCRTININSVHSDLQLRV